jgi:hypothetical protein
MAVEYSDNKPEVTVSGMENQEGHQLIRSKFTRSLRFTVVPMPSRRSLLRKLIFHKHKSHFSKKVKSLATTDNT